MSYMSIIEVYFKVRNRIEAKDIEVCDPSYSRLSSMKNPDSMLLIQPLEVTCNSHLFIPKIIAI